jgi:ribosomal protein S18 acetylase RimI-like enzyme/mono/diheme cytochrome c family protein
VLRAFTAGVNRDGKPLFPLMPYPVYASLSRPDAEALIAYLRTLPARDNAVPPSSLDFPLNLIVRTMPSDATLRTATPEPGTPEHGRYLATIAGCEACHTQENRGKPLPGMAFAGGRSFGTVVSANISPDPLTGIGNWSKGDFLARFRGFATPPPPVGPEDNNTVMPWTMYAGMSDGDLGAIYDYLRTVKPVRNPVEKWPCGRPGRAARRPSRPADWRRSARRRARLRPLAASRYNRGRAVHHGPQPIPPHREGVRMAETATEVQIRPVEELDIEEIAGIDEKLGGRYRPEVWEKRVFYYLRRDPESSFVATAEGAVVGFMLGEVRSGEFGMEEPTGWVEVLGVDPASRAQHRAGGWPRPCSSHFRGLGAHAVSTLVDERMPRSRAFFRSLGFGPAPVKALAMASARQPASSKARD